MKILLLNNEFFPIGGGGSTVCKYTAEYFVKFGHQVHLITSSYKNLSKHEILNGVNIHRIPAVRRYKDFCSWWELISFVFSAIWYGMKFIRQERPDIIQAYFAVPAGGIAWLLTRFYRKIPYFVYLGGSDVPGANPSRFKFLYPFIAPIIRIIFKKSYAITACSYKIHHLAKKIYPKGSFFFIPNGVDTNRFQPVIKEKDNRPIVILGVGRLIKRKGFQFVVKAIPLVINKANKKFKFRIIGAGDYKNELDSLINKLGIEDCIEHFGLVDYTKLHQEYQKVDIFVMPSLSEGMPCALLEAMASGLPAIVTDVSGSDELVKNGENGFRYNVDEQGKDCDIDSLANHLVYLINNDQERDKMGQKSVEIAKAYDWKNIFLKYNQIYNQVVNKK